MAAQAKAVNVLYFDAVLCRAAPFEAGEDGGFVATEEPMPVGAVVTVELLEEADESATPMDRLNAQVTGIRENVTGGPTPGMRLRFTGAATEAAVPKRQPKAAPAKAAEAAPGDGVEPADESAEDSFAAPDKTLEMSAEIPTAEADGGTVEEGPAQGQLPGTGGTEGEGEAAAEGSPKKRRRRRKTEASEAEAGAVSEEGGEAAPDPAPTEGEGAPEEQGGDDSGDGGDGGDAEGEAAPEGGEGGDEGGKKKRKRRRKKK